MSRLLFVITICFLASTGFSDEPTFESLEDEFREKVESLLSGKEERAIADLQAKLASFAKETFGAHPDLIKRETESRFKTLPEFAPELIDEYEEHRFFDDMPLPSPESEEYWLIQSWDPPRLGYSTKNVILARELGVEKYGERALINSLCPDKFYRLGKADLPDLVVQSLGELFIIKIETTKLGPCRPASIKWMKKKVK